MQLTTFTTSKHSYRLVRMMGILLFCMTILSLQVMKIYGMTADVAIEKVDNSLEDLEEKEEVKEKESNSKDLIDTQTIDIQFSMLTKLCFRSMLAKYGVANVEIVSPPPEDLV